MKQKDWRGRDVMAERWDETCKFGHMGPFDRAQLCELLGLDPDPVGVHHQGVSISPAARDVYVARAEGTWDGLEVLENDYD